MYWWWLMPAKWCMWISGWNRESQPSIGPDLGTFRLKKGVNLYQPIRDNIDQYWTCTHLNLSCINLYWLVYHGLPCLSNYQYNIVHLLIFYQSIIYCLYQVVWTSMTVHVWNRVLIISHVSPNIVLEHYANSLFNFF